jgi:hypothetical protein
MLVMSWNECNFCIPSRKSRARAKSASTARRPTHVSPIFARGPHRFAALRVRERAPLETALEISLMIDALSTDVAEVLTSI